VFAEGFKDCSVGRRLNAARDQQSPRTAQCNGVQRIFVLRVAGANLFAQMAGTLQVDLDQIEQAGRALAQPFPTSENVSFAPQS